MKYSDQIDKNTRIMAAQQPQATQATQATQVNPRLETLMRVIEDNQDKMTEGEYLEAMNALGGLYRDATSNSNSNSGGSAANIIPQNPPPYSAVAIDLFRSSYSMSVGLPAGMTREDVLSLNSVKKELVEHREMTPDEWMALTNRQRFDLMVQATLKIIGEFEREYRNPDPKTCPFIARHAVGRWSFGSEMAMWTCVCGYHGKSKHWEKHASSDRHLDWEKHRTVSRRAISNMKKQIIRDEGGIYVKFNPFNCASVSVALSAPRNDGPLDVDNIRYGVSGIRCFLVQQERNEWTHPENYPPILREPLDPAKNLWYVQRREDRSFLYVQ
jgi:hypothetical protein